MHYVILLEVLAVFAVAFAVLGLHRRRRSSIQQERLTAAFDRARAQRSNGCVLQGNALIDPNV